MVLGGAARNRMLIKGGSSFNALVRALKQDVVTGAAPSTTANERLMYEVDKVYFGIQGLKQRLNYWVAEYLNLC